MDSTGLYYYGARYYDPFIGRFISPDTIVPNPSNPQSYNRYSYCLNNPLNRIDPDGHDDYMRLVDLGQQMSNNQQMADVVNSSGGGSYPSYLYDYLNEERNKIQTEVEKIFERTTNSGKGSLSGFQEWGAAAGIGIITLFPEIIALTGISATAIVVGVTIIIPAALGGLAFYGDMKLAESTAFTETEKGILFGGLYFSKQYKKLTTDEVKRLERGTGETAEEMKGSKHAGQRDLYKDKYGNVVVKPKGGNGPGEPTGYNINDYK